MLITAHGGAHNTSRNSKKFFSNIALYNVDVVEVDIWKCGKKLYLSHLPAIPYFRIPLAFAFEFIKKYNFKINCDVKQKGIVKDVLFLAGQMDVLDRIIFTGSVCLHDIKHLTEGEAYLNKSFFKLRHPQPCDVKAMSECIKSCHCPNISGINLKYSYLTEDFLAECEKYNLKVSAFVVDKENEMARLLKHKIIANITSNYPYKLLGKLQLKIKK
ncbi:MAG TPA: hypothetical protein VJ903_00300 [Clostridia bacterium]|nr:hypothetical protein [Clostridia bacterium]